MMPMVTTYKPRTNHHFAACYNQGKDLGGCTLRYDHKRHTLTARFDRDPQRVYLIRGGSL